MDAGYDAGPMDAGYDAGPMDAGYDAGPMWPEFAEVYAVTAAGAVTTGDLAALAAVEASGADLKVRWGDWVVTCGDFSVRTNGGYMCEGWLPFNTDVDPDGGVVSSTDPAEYRIALFNSTGATDEHRYTVESNSNVYDSASTADLQWLARDWRDFRYDASDPVDAGPDAGPPAALQALVDDAQAGTWVTNSGGPHVTAMVITQAGEHVAVLNPWHVSIQTGTNYTFQPNAYHFFQYMNSKDNLDSYSRWRIGAHTAVGNSTGNPERRWFSEPGWELSFRHDVSGNQIEGSLVDLVADVTSGADLHVAMATGNFHRCKRVKVAAGNGTVTCVVNDITNRDIATGDAVHFTDVNWVHQTITTGGVRDTVQYPVGGGTAAFTDNGTAAMAWYTNAWGWESVYRTGAGGSATNGTLAELRAAAAAGADVRAMITLSSGVRSTQECASVWLSPADDSIACLHRAQDTANNYWWLAVLNSNGVLNAHRVTMGTTTEVGIDSQSPDAVEWFVRR
jgi:hypothetical protein